MNVNNFKRYAKRTAQYKALKAANMTKGYYVLRIVRDVKKVIK